MMEQIEKLFNEHFDKLDGFIDELINKIKTLESENTNLRSRIAELEILVGDMPQIPFKSLKLDRQDAKTPQNAHSDMRDGDITAEGLRKPFK